MLGALGLGQPGAADLAVADARHRGADDAGERRVAAGRVDAGDAALLVGVRAELDVDRLLEQPVVRLDAVARREHAVVAGAALVVVDASGRPCRRSAARPPWRSRRRA